eukprot:490594-Prorocentrum_lima.AAC.1
MQCQISANNIRNQQFGCLTHARCCQRSAGVSTSSATKENVSGLRQQCQAKQPAVSGLSRPTSKAR